MKLIIRQCLLLLLGTAILHHTYAQVPSITYSPSTNNLTVGVSVTLTPTNSGGSVPATTYGQVTTIAGASSSNGYTNSTGTSARFNSLQGVVGDGSGNLYVADYNNNAIRKVTSSGLVTTFAGSATGTSGFTNGTGTGATFSGPDGIAIDGSGNLYVSDYNNNAIRKITSAGVVTTFAGSITTPTGLSFDSSGNLIVTEFTPCKVVKISSSGVVTTIAGSGGVGYVNATGTSAKFNCPEDAQQDGSGNFFVADYLNNAIRKITSAGVVTTFAGSATNGNTGGYADGVGTAAVFNNPTGVSVGPGGILYIADFANNDIRKILPDGTVSLVAGSLTQAGGGTNGTGSGAKFNGPDNLWLDGSGNAYISEYASVLRKVVLTGYTISGTLPAGLSFDPTTGIISGTPTTTASSLAYTITAYNASGYSTTTVTLSASAVTAPVISYGTSATLTSGTAFSLTPTNTGGTVPATTYGQVTTIAGVSSSNGYTNATGTSARFNSLQAIVGDGSGNLYVADHGNNAIRKITAAGVVTTFAGSASGTSGFTNGTGTGATFNGPDGIAMDASGNLYVSDYSNNAIRKITPAGVVTTFASSITTPTGLSFDSSGNLIVEEFTPCKVVKISTSGVVTTIAGSGSVGYVNATGSSAYFNCPEDAQQDASGNIFVADYLNNAIRKITSAGVVTTFAGSSTNGNTGGFADGLGTAARFNNPTGVAIGPGGIVYVADFANHNIRRVMPDGTVSLIAGSTTQASGSANGIGTAAKFNGPDALYLDGAGNGYISEYSSDLRKIVLTGYSLKGTLPAGLVFDPTTGIISGTPTGTIMTQTDTITAYNAGGYAVATVTFGPPSVPPTISYASGSLTYILGTPITPLVPVITGNPAPYSYYTTTYAGSGADTSLNGPAATAGFTRLLDNMTTDRNGNVYVLCNNVEIRKIAPSGIVSTLAGSQQNFGAEVDGVGAAAHFYTAVSLTTDVAGNVYVAEYNKIRKVTPEGVTTTFAGGNFGSADGPALSAGFNAAQDMCFDQAGNMYVVDLGNNKIRMITPQGIVSTFAGTGTAGYLDGPAASAEFNNPFAITIDRAGNIYVWDYNNARIRKISGGVVTTFAGNGVIGRVDGVGTAAGFAPFKQMATDASGTIYIDDYSYGTIREISPAGVVKTITIPGNVLGVGLINGLPSVAEFNNPVSIAVDSTGNIYIGDSGSNVIRKMIATAYTISPALPQGLTFDTATGIISGTPTLVADTTITYTITAYNGAGIGSTTLNLKISSLVTSTPANDYDKNWIYTRSYDENGTEMGASKSFFDNNGKPTQAQTKNETAGQVLATQTIYDLQGRGAVNTLAAPINNAAFAYNNNFVTNGGSNYNYQNFDGDPTNTSNPYAKLNSPDAVDNTQIGSLGWYYSNNNTFEPYVAATEYPYSRNDFYHDGTGVAKRSAGIGEQLKMGTGHETTSNSFPVQNELNNYLAIRNQFFASAVGGSPTNMAGQALQSISTDQNGLNALSITDLSGKMSLMTGRADPAGWLNVQNGFSLTSVHGQYSFNIHIDGPSSVQGNPNDPQVIALMHGMILNFGISSNTPVTVTCTSNPSIPTWTGNGSDYVHPLPTLTGSYSFNVTSDYPFTISATNAYGTVYDQAEATYAEPSGNAIQYFQLSSPSIVTVTGNFILYSMSADADITSTFTSGNTILPAGFYKVSAVQPTVGNPPNTVTVSYVNKYSDLSYNYYNQIGQLIASIPPNGVQQLIQNGYSSYTSASQLPFVTLYAYDLQGRLTSTTTPDGGTSNFVYRQDGKIRFSQNAYQANSANAGTGNAERFSYTNYDNIGRPVESGEYTVTTATFSTLAANTTLLEATDATANVSGANKQFQINTYYDVPATNLTLTGYTQDPGFLKGAVSYTSNANSTTWYNYDDHGRVTWTVKQISGLTGYKTVDYTYNDQGNVTRVDYQKGTPAERFIHYYAYDADGRLTNVQTSTDDITKVQQAAYTYYLHGPLKRTELGDQLQGIDYVYTPQGWLKSINSPAGDATKDPNQDGLANSFAKDAFGIQLEYFPGDYSRTTNSGIASIATGQQNYYNGNVNGISWQSNKPSSVVSTYGTGIQNPAMYTYSYDPKYQLAGSTWGTPSYTANTFTGAANNMFQEKNIAYDFNGNITGLQRTNSSGALSDNFSSGYAYQTGTNKLTSVTNATTSTAYATYDYDELGRMKRETLTGAPNPYYIKYDVTGKIIGIYSDAAMTILLESYTYDESGNRIKTVNPNGTTYYVYDAKNNVMAIYTGTTPTMTEVPFYGSSNRLGTYTISSSNYAYEIKDNVGSVRVVINRTKNSSGQADITTFNDYFPYGSLAQSGGTSYRYDYQGAYAEKDSYTGWNDFQLRMYDGRIGRWLNVDPKGQFVSPYEGMGNNPVTGIDKTGGEEGDEESSPDIIITGSDNKTLTIKAPGPDININTDQKIGKDQTIDLGIQNLNNLAIGYSSNLSGQLQLLWGASGFVELDHVLFFDKTYGGYWYDYLGGGGTVRLGAGGGLSGTVGANLFIAYNTSGRPVDPSTWAGATYFAGYDIDVKDVIGAGVNAQFFGNSTWKGISIGGSLGAGFSANIGTGFVGASYSKQLTPSVPTSNRSYLDIGLNWYNNTIGAFMGLPKF